MRAAQIVVAHLDTSVHSARVNRRFDRSLGGVRRVKAHRAAGLFKLAAHGRDSQVLYRKLRGCVVRINLPGLRLCQAER